MPEVAISWGKMITAITDVAGEPDVKGFIRQAWIANYGLTREKQLYDALKREVTDKAKAVAYAQLLARQAVTYAALGNPSHERWDCPPTRPGNLPSGNRRTSFPVCDGQSKKTFPSRICCTRMDEQLSRSWAAISLGALRLAPSPTGGHCRIFPNLTLGSHADWPESTQRRRSAERALNIACRPTEFREF